MGRFQRHTLAACCRQVHVALTLRRSPKSFLAHAKQKAAALEINAAGGDGGGRQAGIAQVVASQHFEFGTGLKDEALAGTAAVDLAVGRSDRADRLAEALEALVED